MKVNVTVSVEIDAESLEEVHDVISECDYNFTFEGKELDTEIVDVDEGRYGKTIY